MSNLSQSNLSNSSLRSTEQTINNQFLKFLLYPDTKAMLPIGQVTEVLKIQFGQIVPIPQMSSWVMGVYNWRGDILWMVDLGYLLGLNSWYHQQSNRSSYTAIVLSPYRESQGDNTTNHVHLGLVVAQVSDLEVCPPQAIQASLGSTSSPRLEQFLTGYWLKPDGEMILALNSQAIAAAMPTNSS